MAPYMPARVANVWFIETRCLEHLRDQNGGWCPKGLHDSVGQYLGIEPKRGSQKRAIAAAAYLWCDRARYSVRGFSRLRRCTSFVNTYIRRSCSGPASSGRLLPYSDFQWTHQTTLFSSWMMTVGSATRSSSLSRASICTRSRSDPLQSTWPTRNRTCRRAWFWTCTFRTSVDWTCKARSRLTIIRRSYSSPVTETFPLRCGRSRQELWTFSLSHSRRRT
jgi:hypothetical protein